MSKMQARREDSFPSPRYDKQIGGGDSLTPSSLANLFAVDDLALVLCGLAVKLIFEGLVSANSHLDHAWKLGFGASYAKVYL